MNYLISTAILLLAPLTVWAAIAAVPEPSTLTLFGAAAVGLAIVGLKKKNK